MSGKRTRKLIERLTGWRVERYGAQTVILTDKRQRVDAWFSRSAQIRSIIERRRVDLVLDVGANEGQFTRELRSFYAGEVHSFEPVSSVYAKLAEAASSDGSWHAHKLALGSRDCMQAINVSKKSAFSSLLTANDYCQQRFGGKAPGSTEETVRVRRLDGCLPEIVPDFRNRKILLKLDTQGYDRMVFEGAGAVLGNVVALLSEVSLVPIYEGMPHWTESIATYERAGFGIVGLFPVSHDGERVVEYDCLLSRMQD